MLGMMVGLLLTSGRQPPENPVKWMRLNFVILLVAIFLGSATRHFQISLVERQTQRSRDPDGWVPDPSTRGATQPATAPTTGPATLPSP
jgi:hypothetical protein